MVLVCGVVAGFPCDIHTAQHAAAAPPTTPTTVHATAAPRGGASCKDQPNQPLKAPPSTLATATVTTARARDSGRPGVTRHAAPHESRADVTPATMPATRKHPKKNAAELTAYER